LIFGITHLLGIRFAPRIKDLPDQRLWRLPDSAPYQHIEAAVSDKLNVNLIRDTWDEMLRLAASLKYGDEKASLITGWMSLTIRAAGDPMSLAAAVRRETRAIDPDQPIGAIRTMEQVLSESVSEPRYRTGLLGLFAPVALILAGVGIYGVVAYTTALRSREIGVRLALGAQSKDVLKLIIGQGMRLALAGLLLGLGGALSLTRVMKTLLFGISATDPLTFAVIALLLMVVALVACWLPARRATKVDPMNALRSE
jgi:ABC-type antimicrobial peptide transport system permease subunit